MTEPEAAVFLGQMAERAHRARRSCSDTGRAEDEINGIRIQCTESPTADGWYQTRYFVSGKRKSPRDIARLVSERPPPDERY